MLHVNPRLATKGLLVVFNPLDEDVTRDLKVPLYYTGLRDVARVSVGGESTVEYVLDRKFQIDLAVDVPAGGMTWCTLR